MWDWVNANKEWFFSGAGVTLLAACGWFIRRAFAKSGDTATQSQRSGAFSKNNQIGSITINSDRDGK